MLTQKIVVFNIPEMFEAFLEPFCQLFSVRVWHHAQVLLVGAILSLATNSYRCNAGDGTLRGKAFYQAGEGDVREWRELSELSNYLPVDVWYLVNDSVLGWGGAIH